MEQKDLNYIIEAHRDHPRKPSKAFRKWDGKTDYHIHPIWCATMISTETALEDTTRQEGILTLLYHDILEDTTMPLPEWLSARVKDLIDKMTFRNGSSQEMQEIWHRPKEVRLYKLYDKVSNILDGTWMDDEKIKLYSTYTMSLCDDATRNYGPLNITKIAELMAKEQEQIKCNKR